MDGDDATGRDRARRAHAEGAVAVGPILARRTDGELALVDARGAGERDIGERDAVGACGTVVPWRRSRAVPQPGGADSLGTVADGEWRCAGAPRNSTDEPARAERAGGATCAHGPAVGAACTDELRAASSRAHAGGVRAADGAELADGVRAAGRAGLAPGASVRGARTSTPRDVGGGAIVCIAILPGGVATGAAAAEGGRAVIDDFGRAGLGRAGRRGAAAAGVRWEHVGAGRDVGRRGGAGRQRCGGRIGNDGARVTWLRANRADDGRPWCSAARRSR